MLRILENKIKNARLTKTDRRIADFALENFPKFGFMTAAAISGALGVSDASVIRFARTLGYSGFADLQKYIRSQISEQMGNGCGGQATPLERLNRIIPYLTDDDFAHSMMKVISKNFEDTFKLNSMSKIEQVSRRLIRSRKKYIIGLRSSQGMARMFAGLLAMTLGDVHAVLYSDAGVDDTLMDLGPEDCAVIISFPRYSRSAAFLSDFVRNSGAKRIVITDKATSLVAKKADILLCVSATNISFTNSYVVVTFLLELISADIIRKSDPAAVKTRIGKYDDLNPPQGL